jgi:hypothetical protein
MIAHEGQHYILAPNVGRMPSFRFTSLGLKVLDWDFRNALVATYYAGKLGNSLEIPDNPFNEYESIEEFEPIPAGEYKEIATTPEEWRQADRIYDEGRDDACLGLDTPGARMYKLSRSKS